MYTDLGRLGIGILLGLSLSMNTVQSQEVPDQPPNSVTDVAVPLIEETDNSTSDTASDTASTENVAVPLIEEESNISDPNAIRSDPIDPNLIDPNANLDLIGNDSTRPTIALERNGKQITATKMGPDDAGFAITCTPDDSTPNAPVKVIYYDPSAAGVSIQIDTTTIVAAIADLEKYDGGDGNFSLFAGSAEYSDTSCLPIITAINNPKGVTATQGKTIITGSRLVYSEKTGFAELAGPIVFKRPQGKDMLEGSADRLVFDIDQKITTFSGNVKLSSGTRSSSAQEMQIDDAKNSAILRGSRSQPVVTTLGTDTLTAVTLNYNLDNNDVVAIGQISGSLSDGQ